jgi:preprotein translocase subunit SecG
MLEGDKMNLAPFAPFLSVAEIVLAIVMVVLVLLQSKGSNLAGFMGGSDSSAGSRTRRGVEATLHRVTIYFAIAFFVNTALTFIALGQAG